MGEFFEQEYSGFIRKIALKGLKSAKDEEVAEWFVRVGYMFRGERRT